jgi:glucose/arabinose dehydrogenase
MVRAVTRRRLLAAGIAGLSSLAGCGGDAAPTPSATPDTPATPAYDASVDHDPSSWPRYDPDWTAPTTAPTVDLAVEPLIERLEIPWDLAVAPNGDLFLTERTGRIRRYRSGEVTAVARPADAIDAGAKPPGSDERSWFLPGGEGGTMGVAVHPRYPDVPLLYVYYTATTDGGRTNRLAALDLAADDPAARARTLLTVPAGNVHNGGRIAFGPADYLWVTTGDTGEGSLARDPGSLAGAVLRITPEGDPAPDNPDRDRWDPRVYTTGHRNPQGITWLPDGRPVISEHGPGPDEVSLPDAGGDYGWPAVRAPEEYRTADADYRPPVASSAGGDVWAPSGCVFYTGDGVPALRNRLLIGCLGSQRVLAVTLTPPGADPPPLGETGRRHDGAWLDDRYTATTHTLLSDRLGRVRHVEQGADGALYALTSNRDGRARGRFPTDRDDRLVRITPASA